MLLANDFVGVSDSKKSVEHRYCSKWRLQVKASKRVVMIFLKVLNCLLEVREHSLPKLSYYFSGIDFSTNGAWD